MAAGMNRLNDTADVTVTASATNAAVGVRPRSGSTSPRRSDVVLCPWTQTET